MGSKGKSRASSRFRRLVLEKGMKNEELLGFKQSKDIQEV